MIRCDNGDRHETFTQFIHEWFRRLAQGDMTSACDMLDEPNGNGLVWTPDSIRALVTDSFGSGTVFSESHPEGLVFCAPEDVPMQPPATQLVEFTDGTGFALDHHLPLNGEWSDLTAQFEFLNRQSGYAVVLHDLHVM